MSDLKRFFERGSRPVSSRELIDFKGACSTAEYEAFVAEARRQNEAFEALAA